MEGSEEVVFARVTELIGKTGKSAYRIMLSRIKRRYHPSQSCLLEG